MQRKYHLTIIVSRPAWGAWIEMLIGFVLRSIWGGRAPHGARGLKFCFLTLFRSVIGVAPRMGRVD